MSDTIIKQKLLDWLDEEMEFHARIAADLMADEGGIRADVRRRTCAYIAKAVKTGEFDTAARDTP